MYMNLNVAAWKYFRVADIFDIYNGIGITKEEIESNPGTFNAVQSGTENNGCIGKIDINYCKSMNYTLTEEPCLTVARTGSAGFVTYQPFGCVVGDSAKALIIKNKCYRKPCIYLFLRTILMKLEYKYDFGRKVTEQKYLSEEIWLPTDLSENPDWEFMELYIKSLRNSHVTTKVAKGKNIPLDTSSWKVFYFHRIMHAEMGNGIDAITTTSDNPKYNYVSRDSNGNGVVSFIDEIEGERVFPAGAMSLALGGSFLGSCFIQKAPFYTAQNVAVLQEKVPMTVFSKLFIATLIRNECRIKYQAFGRELNSHFRKDFTIKLPVLHDTNGPIIDTTKCFSDEGWIPDWKWMDHYIQGLPYSDRI